MQSGVEVKKKVNGAKKAASSKRTKMEITLNNDVKTIIETMVLLGKATSVEDFIEKCVETSTTELREKLINAF